jgi:hypothetical protein
LRGYVHSLVEINNRPSTNVYFPLLQVYNSSGKLVYIGHNAEANAQFLQELPDDIAGLQPDPSAATLQKVMQQFPEFALKSDAVLQTGKPTVVTVFLEDCHACSVQEQALDNSQQRLHDRGINLLIIHVAKPT